MLLTSRFRALAMTVALVAGACVKKPVVTAPPLEQDALVQMVRSRPVPDPTQARFSIKMRSKPLGIAAPPLGGGLVVDRPGRAHIAILGPTGSPVVTLSSDGTRVVFLNTHDRQYITADNAATLLGGATGDAVSLTRDQSPDSPSLNLPGIDSRRATGSLDWRRILTTSQGLRIEPFVNARMDAYSLSDVPTGVGRAVTSKSVARGLGVLGADISYPLYRRRGDATVVLEPLVQIALSPDAKQVVIGKDTTGKPVYLNEDSLAFEFDETTLFRPDKFPGFDLYEDGARLNVAGRASVLWDDGRRASLLVGRSFRAEPDLQFPTRSGLQSKTSDWIVAAEGRPVDGFNFFTRARFDAGDLAEKLAALREMEVVAYRDLREFVAALRAPPRSRPMPCAWWCPIRSASGRTWWRAAWPSGWRSAGASRCWWTTSPADRKSVV